MTEALVFLLVLAACVAPFAYGDHVRDHRTTYPRLLPGFDSSEWAPGKYRGAP